MRHTIFAILFLMATLSLANAQIAKQPQKDDPNLYFGALNFIRAVYQHSLAAASQGQSATVQYALRKELNVSEEDFAILVREAKSMTALSQQESSGAGKNSAWRASTGGAQQGNIAASVVTDRLSIINAATKRLSNELSANGWQHFRNFVNGPFLRSTVITTGSK